MDLVNLWVKQKKELSSDLHSYFPAVIRGSVIAILQSFLFGWWSRQLIFSFTLVCSKREQHSTKIYCVLCCFPPPLRFLVTFFWGNLFWCIEWTMTVDSRLVSKVSSPLPESAEKFKSQWREGDERWTGINNEFLMQSTSSLTHSGFCISFYFLVLWNRVFYS